MKKFIYLSAKFVGIILFKILFYLEVKGREYIPKKGPFILASNHTSYLDPIVLGISSPRPLNYLAKISLFKNRIFASLIRIFGAIPLERESSFSYTLRSALTLLKEKKGVVIFPEGTRSEDGVIKDGKGGVGFLSIKSHAPVIPVKIKGTGKALPVKEKFVKPTKVKVIIGPPLYFEKGNYSEIGKIVMEKVRELK